MNQSKGKEQREKEREREVKVTVVCVILSGCLCFREKKGSLRKGRFEMLGKRIE